MKKRKQKEERSLLGAWVCDMANRLMDESEVPMTQSKAFRQAHLVRRLLEKLGQGRVTFLYEKQDGTTRQARGTLCHGVSEGYDNYRYKKIMTSTNSHPNDLYFTYWDLDREAFRAFSALRIVKIIAYSHTETRVLSSHRVTEDTELGTENLFINAGE